MKKYRLSLSGRVALVIASASILAGCAGTNYAGVPPQDLARQMKVVDSEFDKIQLFVAPEIRGKGEGGDTTYYRAALVASRDKTTGQLTHALKVDMQYLSSQWVFFSRGTLKGGRELVTRVLDRQVQDCSGAIRLCTYSESLFAVIPPEFLKYHLDNKGLDLPVRIGGDRDSFVISLSGDYIRGYLEGVRQLTPN